MITMNEQYNNQIEIINSIFTVIDGNIKILLFKRNEEPFKGYWMLPSNLLMTNETIEQCSLATIKEYSGYSNVYIEQSNIKSDISRLPNSRTIACSFIAIIDKESPREKINIESEFFNINEIPKLVYDHDLIIQMNISILKDKIKNNKLIDIFYKSDFTLPELQKMYEVAYEKTFDRRNFRKKLINMNIIEDTGFKNKSEFGRPAKLYRFKKNDLNF